jgi:glutamine phosphoribosylpyrophosphate amidotransferase
MCGIIGYKPFGMYENQIDAFQRLFEQSVIRGLHAYGIADDSKVFRTFKASEVIQHFDPTMPTIAHARYCQSGDWRVLKNNQPIAVNRMTLAMNGVISMGTKAEFEAEYGVTCTVDNDSEIFLRKIEGAHTPEDVVRRAEIFVGAIRGSFAGTFLVDGVLFAGRNPRRPLWKCHSYGAIWYASTEDIFRRAGFAGAEPVAVGVEVA